MVAEKVVSLQSLPTNTGKIFLHFLQANITDLGITIFSSLPAALAGLSFK
jgi:hypothetical protein